MEQEKEKEPKKLPNKAPRAAKKAPASVVLLRNLPPKKKKRGNKRK